MTRAELHHEVRAALAAYRHGVVVRGFNGPDGCTEEEAVEMMFAALSKVVSFLTEQATAGDGPA